MRSNGFDQQVKSGEPLFTHYCPSSQVSVLVSFCQTIIFSHEIWRIGINVSSHFEPAIQLSFPIGRQAYFIDPVIS